MATYTSNYGLHQWAPEDNFLRTDFNEDLKKIDTALKNAADAAKAKASAATGAYTGNDAATRTIDLGFRPRAVLVENSVGSRYGSHSGNYITGGLAVDGYPVRYKDNNGTLQAALEIVSNGFRVRQGWDYRGSLNSAASTYHYLAVQ